MSDILLSYESRDLDKAKILAAALQLQGWTVFFDRTIPPGKTWRQVIGKEIDECRCMVVAWSTHSVNSTWVEVEADIGLKREILVPLLLDQVTPPLGFGAIQAANLVGWKGETDSSAYLALCNALAERLGPGVVSTSGADKATNKPQEPAIRWPKQLMLKVGKITVITATLVILLWYLVPVLLSQKEDTIPAPATSTDLKVTNQPLIKEPVTLVKSADPEVIKHPLIKEPKIQAQRVEPKVTNQPSIKEPEMVSIPAGTFQMGSNNGGDDEKPVHTVTLKSFAIGRYEVTFEQYDQFAEATGKSKPDDSGWGRGKRPVNNVSWKDAVAYAQWLTEKTGKYFRLPTEAEWEYAARAKTTSDYYWDGQVADFAWFAENSESKTHPVGELKPNAFGVYDMAGNVWEWVQDCYEGNYKQAPKNGSAWEAQNCTFRVLRGGSWSNGLDSLRSADRDWNSSDARIAHIGFRLAQD